jgi:nucleoid-associated protein YgaU
VSLGSLAAPAPAIPQDQYVSANAFGAYPPGSAPYTPQAPGQLGQDLSDLGEAGGRVIGHVGQGLWTGAQVVGDGVAKAAPVVGQTLANGAQAVANGVSKAAPVVGRAVWNGGQSLADYAPQVGHGLWAGIKHFFSGIGHFFSFHKKQWEGPVVVVQPGDTLATIAKRTMGDASRWYEIYQWNADLIQDPRQALIPGQMLRLPPYIDQQVIVGGAPAVEPTAPAPAPAPRPAGSYTVKKGDTLSALARRFYGDETRWPEIYQANRNKIDDPHWIYPGQVFTIPRG